MPRIILPLSELRRRSAGFTLIELLVTISIIAILAGISIPVITSMLKAADSGRMKSSLAGLRAAAEEYQVMTDSNVDHTLARFPSFPSLQVEAKDVPGNNTIQLFVYEAGKVPSVASLLVSSARKDLKIFDGTDFVVLADPTLITDPAAVQLLDAFGNPVRYAAFVDKGDAFTDDDYLPAHPGPFFASAGPDGLWGTVNRSGEPDADAEDNLYSFDDL
ncbi:type II secretion system protein [Phycisphaera mikurensis]|uniref:Uncharacterized protein n=1 Tax=Phycisphaera mikurensis (strain NBRC 102666 / KCTC 22515 / FYK2301M01) TaxID=1142394 RepID=I0IFZ5_PHYMF|nr:type II secretion system protein [Phycisphaera mikurensis]MBB6440431.1 prepilin-type N-terminal cleavage/methylation domain-containing protein [Phycisphaera mikurensis]BAM04183.1 hypothetical protein PSMK_20240 [Phycisphaera mikurensis NBRC 102666]